MKLTLNVLCVTTLLLSFCTPAIADAAPTAEQYYARALETMKQLPQPENATYTVDVATTGASFGVVRDKKTNEAGIWWTLGSKKPGTPHFDGRYRGANDTTTIGLADGPAITRVPMFNPTWSGISDWMRFGLFPPKDAAVRAKASPESSASIRTIATVRAMGVAYYNVSDAGSQSLTSPHISCAKWNSDSVRAGRSRRPDGWRWPSRWLMAVRWSRARRSNST